MHRKRVVYFQIFLYLLLSLYMSNLAVAQVNIGGIDSLMFVKSVENYLNPVEDTFYLHKMMVIPDGLQLGWDADKQKFSLYGAAKIHTSEEEIYVSVGNADAPGIVVKNDVLDAVSFGITSTFDLKGISAIPDSLSFEWDKEEGRYKIYGALAIGVDGDTLDVLLGDAEKPGMEIKDGVVEKIDVGVSKEFELKTLSIAPKELTFNWNKDSAVYHIFGDIEVKIEGDSLQAILGNSENPGIKINNGQVEHINIGITSEFNMKSLRIVPDELTFEWDKNEDNFDMYGNIEIDIEGDTLQAKLGGANDPGIEISNGKVEHINIGVSDTFELKSMRFVPNDLHFYYDHADDDYNIHGSVELDLEGDSIDAYLGDANNPGIEIKQGKPDKINIGITETFNLKGLEIETDTLGFDWQDDKDGEVFHLYGKVDLDIEGRKIGFSFGTPDNPGLVFKNGKISSYEIGTSEDLFFGGMEVSTQDFTIGHNGSKYHVGGQLIVKELWEAILDLGEGEKSGISIKTENSKTLFDVGSVVLEIKEIELGTFTLKDLKFGFKDNQISDIALDVEVPPGQDFGGEITFNNGALHALTIDWEAENYDEALPLPGTGAEIAYIKGEFINLDDLHNLEFQGDMWLCLGGPFVVGGKEVSILYIDAKALINRHKLGIESGVYVGAYEDGDDGWKALLGDGHIKFDFNWGQMYTVAGNMNVPAGDNAIIKANIAAQLSSTGGFNAQADVHLQVPGSIPLIGGMEFAEADGAVHYDKTDPSSFAAGWVDVNLVFDSFKKGVKYTFKDKSYDVIGAKEINNINRNVSTKKEWYWDKKAILISGGEIAPHYLQVKVKLKKKFDWIFADVHYDMQQVHNYSNCYFVHGKDKISGRHVDFSTLEVNETTRFKDTDELTFYILPTNSANQKARLSAGDYWVELGSDETSDMVKSMQVHKIYEEPNFFWSKDFMHWDVRPDGKVKDFRYTWERKANVFYDDKTELSAYWIQNGHKKKLISKTIAGQSGQKVRVDYTFHGEINPGDTIWLYGVIDDKLNTQVSGTQKQLKYEFLVKGKIEMEGGDEHASRGIDVNVLVNTNGSEPWSNLDVVKKTVKGGLFGFTQHIVPGTEIKLEIGIPRGYEVDPSSTSMPGEIYKSNDHYGYDFGTIKLRKKI